MAVLAALGQERQLKVHIRFARHVGLTDDEIVEVDADQRLRGLGPGSRRPARRDAADHRRFTPVASEVALDLVGDLELGVSGSASGGAVSSPGCWPYHSFAINGAPGHLLTVHHADPDTPSAQALALQSSVSAEQPEAEPSSSAPAQRSGR